MSAIIVGGVGAALTVEDVLKVALGAACSVDAAVLDKLDREASAPPAKGAPRAPPAPAESADAVAARLSRLSLACASPTSSPATSGFLSSAEARAVVCVKLAELAGARKPPPAPLLLALSHLLSASAGTLSPQLPAAASDAEALSALVELLQPASPGERSVLLAGSAPSLALASLAAARCRTHLLPLSDAVGALCCEALGCTVTSFSESGGDDAPSASAAPHKQELLVCSELTALLEGSKRVNPRKGGSSPPCALGMPAVHGRAREAAALLATACRTELNSVRPGIAQDGATAASGAAPASTAVQVAAAALQGALSAAIHASAARARAVGASDADITSEALQTQLRPAAAAVAEALGWLSEAAAGGEPCDSHALLVARACSSACALLSRTLGLEASASAAAIEKSDAAAIALRAAPPPPAVEPVAGAKPGAPGGKAPGGGGPAALGRGTSLLKGYVGGGGLLDESNSVQLLCDIRALVEATAGVRKPKLAKGTRDFLPDQMAIREGAFASIVSVFKRHGAVALDTPVFELRSTLTGKYGEDSKLIYDLADQGGEALSLRYDLTVPFARYLAMHAVGNIKRYHIARVYRRDQPQMSRGRFREFYQCDFDIAGAYPVMMADAEVLKVLTEVLGGLDLGGFAVKLNHRKLLDAVMEVSGVPNSKFRAICSAIDKLDKESWATVRAEMIDEKGLSPDVADRIGTFVQLKSPQGSPRALLDQLAVSNPFGAHEGAAAALLEMGTLFDYLEAMGALSHFSFDFSLARGLDYYTGVIYEAVLTALGHSVGSIGGGGRYDNLVGMFSGKVIPAVGVSIGIERVFAILEERARAAAAAPGGTPIRATQTQVLVCSIGGGLATHRMRLANTLWSAGIKAEYLYQAAPNMAKQLERALDQSIPLLVIFGEDELARGELKLKRLADKEEVSVKEGELVERVRGMLGLAAADAQPCVVVS